MRHRIFIEAQYLVNNRSTQTRRNLLTDQSLTRKGEPYLKVRWLNGIIKINVLIIINIVWKKETLNQVPDEWMLKFRLDAQMWACEKKFPGYCVLYTSLCVFWTRENTFEANCESLTFLFAGFKKSFKKTQNWRHKSNKSNWKTVSINPKKGNSNQIKFNWTRVYSPSSRHSIGATRPT